ncbi:acetolactate decarboxylase [Sphaerochaeta globosa]|nr:acetolactate decarboxylase [Sphaerochaeta globosa]
MNFPSLMLGEFKKNSFTFLHHDYQGCTLLAKGRLYMKYWRVRSRRFLLVCMLVVVLVLSGCSTLNRQSGHLFQVSLLNALLLGEYDGFLPVEDLKRYGDIGIGTFDTLDGEMILLDGTVYQAKADGTVLPVGDSIMIPFAMATHFSPTLGAKSLSSISGIEALKTSLDRMISSTTNDFNRFYVVKLEGSFSHVRIRSVPAQEKPYQRLATIAASQKEYVLQQVDGSIVAFRCPDYVQGINMPGWHLHFLSSDTLKGGHLLEVDVQEAELEMGDMKEYTLVLPDSESFAAMDIAHDLSKETQAVEGIRK